MTTVNVGTLGEIYDSEGGSSYMQTSLKFG